MTEPMNVNAYEDILGTSELPKLLQSFGNVTFQLQQYNVPYTLQPQDSRNKEWKKQTGRHSVQIITPLNIYRMRYP